MESRNRHESSDKYRYGFNGKEKDDEVKGEGNNIDFGERMYDTRVGKWFKIDNLKKKYPSQSSYNYALNNPIYNIDPDGNIVIPWIKWGFWGRSFPSFTDIFSTDTKFYKTYVNLATNSSVFRKVITQLEVSPRYYKFRSYNVTNRDSYNKIKNNKDLGGAFEPKHKGTKEDPFLVSFPVNFINETVHTDNSIVVFEEIFHAGQNEFINNNGTTKSALAMEIEVKLVKNIEGIADGSNGFSYEKINFKGSEKVFEKIRGGEKLTAKELKSLREGVNGLTKRVAALYKMDKKDIKNFNMDFDLDYAESLYGDFLQNNHADNEVIITSVKKKKK